MALWQWWPWIASWMMLFRAKCAKSNIETIISFPCKIVLALHRYAACCLVIWCVKMTRVSTEMVTSCVTVTSFVMCVCAHCLYQIIPWCCSLTAARWLYISTEWHFFTTSYENILCDAIGGTVKQLAASHSLKATFEGHIVTPFKLYYYDWAKNKIAVIRFL